MNISNDKVDREFYSNIAVTMLLIPCGSEQI